MTKPRKKRGRNKGWFKKGDDPRRSDYRPTREECQRGHAAAKAKLSERGIDASAWFFRHIRKWYSSRKRGSHGEEENGHGPTADVPY